MIKIENVVLPSAEQWDAVIRGMRNPMNSWDKSDSHYGCGGIDCDECNYVDLDISECPTWFMGVKDKELALKLSNAGSVHAKYRRMIGVYADITSHHTWWAEFDTYKIGTVRNSCSKMHKINVKKFTLDDFSHEGIDEVGGEIGDRFINYIATIEYLRCRFNATQDKNYWRALIEMLPMGFNLKATVFLNYEVLSNIYKWRNNHKLDEWREFCKWIESLPHSELITGVV